MSFRCKTILGIGLIGVVFLFLLIWQASSYLHESNESAFLARARDTLTLAGSFITKALEASDLDTLEEQANWILALDGVDYVRISGLDRQLVSVGTGENEGATHQPDSTFTDAEQEIFEQAYELRVADQTLGTLELGMPVRDLKQMPLKTQVRFYGIVSAALTLVVLCSWLLANLLTSKLNHRWQASHSPSNGGSRRPLSQQGHDELTKTLMTAVPDGIATLDKDGVVVFANPSLAALLGQSETDLRGKLLSGLLGSTPDFGTVGQMAAVASKPRWIETVISRADGTSVSTELKVATLDTGGKNRFILIIRDISVRKTKEKELVEARRLAEQASVARSRFLAHMSHEIRSPLNAVLGSLDLIVNRAQTDDFSESFIRLARSSSDALMQVVDEILDFSRIEAGQIIFERCRFSLARLLDEVLETVVTHRPDNRVIMRHEISDQMPHYVFADRNHLRQVLGILLDSTCKFTDAGNVLVRADVEPALMEQGSGWLTLEVRDTGPGIPPDQVETMFAEFEQVDPARDSGFGGSGLGLAIARQLVEGMGGTIGVESTLSIGTIFFIGLPFSTVETAPKSVLLVDDVEINLLIGSEMLKSRGFDVHLAHDGLEAVAMASATRYDVILMDLRMPRLNGLEATRQIRRSDGPSARTPIIAVTANAEKTEMLRCKEAGMDDFISKPLDMERLVHSINQCILESESDNMQKQRPGQAAEILSEPVLQQLARDTSSDAFPRMLAVFMGEVKKRVQLIEDAFENEDEAELGEQAHALNSCAGTFGGLRLQESARQLEEAATAGRAMEIPELVEGLGKVAEGTLIAYAQYQAGLESGS